VFFCLIYTPFLDNFLYIYFYILMVGFYECYVYICVHLVYTYPIQEHNSVQYTIQMNKVQT